MKSRLLNSILQLHGYTWQCKEKVVESRGFIETIPNVVLLLVSEVLFIIVSFPMFLLVSPSDIQEEGIVFSKKHPSKKRLASWDTRSRVGRMTAVSAMFLVAVKVLFVGIISSYLLGVVPLLAATQDWSFDTAGNYTYDTAKIEVTGGVAQLKNLVTPASGGTTNAGLDSGSTGWTFVPTWSQPKGTINAGAYNASGGNPGVWHRC